MYISLNKYLADNRPALSFPGKTEECCDAFNFDDINIRRVDPRKCNCRIMMKQKSMFDRIAKLQKLDKDCVRRSVEFSFDHKLGYTCTIFRDTDFNYLDRIVLRNQNISGAPRFAYYIAIILRRNQKILDFLFSGRKDGIVKESNWCGFYVNFVKRDEQSGTQETLFL